MLPTKEETWVCRGRSFPSEEAALDFEIGQAAITMANKNHEEIRAILKSTTGHLYEVLHRLHQLKTGNCDSIPNKDDDQESQKGPARSVYDGHTPSCRYRATGVRGDCNCIGKIAPDTVPIPDSYYESEDYRHDLRKGMKNHRVSAARFLGQEGCANLVEFLETADLKARKRAAELFVPSHYKMMGA